MLGLGTLRRVTSELRLDIAAAHQRDPAARGVSSVEVLIAWPGVQAVLAHRVAHALHDSNVPIVPRAIAYLSRMATGDRDPPGRQHRRRPVHRPRHGRRDRRDGRHRRRRHALPGRHARRHRLCHRQAPSDGRRQRHHRVGRQAARADRGRSWREGRRQLGGHHRRAAELHRGRQSRPCCPRRRQAPRGPRRRLDPPSRPGGRSDPRALQPPHRARASPCGDLQGEEPPAEVRRLRPMRGRNPAGG